MHCRLGKRVWCHAAWVATATLWVLLSSSAALGDLMEIRGTRVSLDPPQEFEASPFFPGLQHRDITAAIVINEVPTPYLELAKQYSDAGLTKSSMELIKREFIEKDGLSGQLLLVRQILRGENYERWILITGDTTESVMIAGYYPVDYRSRLNSALETSLRGSLWDSARAIDHFDGLGFRIDDVPSLRVVTRMSNSLVFTETGRMPDRYYTDALLMMSLKPVPEGSTLTEGFAQAQFNNIAIIEQHTVKLTQSKAIAGNPGVVVEGTGRHRHLGYEVAVMQIILNTPSGFLVAQGFTKKDDMENDFDVFRATISSFRLESDPS